MATVSPEVAAKQLLTVFQALLNYQYVNTTTDLSKLADALTHVSSNLEKMVKIANSTGLTKADINRTLNQVSNCLKADSLSKWNCLKNTGLEDIYKSIYCTALMHDLDALLLAFLLSFTIVFVIVWSFVGKRKSCLLNCCFGLPRAIVPVNMLDSYENRFGHAAAFGVTSVYCIKMLFGSVKSILGSKAGVFIDQSPGFVSILFKMLGTGVISMSAFPLFACMSTNHKVVGSILGLLHSITWTGMLIFIKKIYFDQCADRNKEQKFLMFTIFQVLPQFLCLLFLEFKFGFILVKAVRKRQGKWSEDATELYDTFKTQYLFTHVKNLLKGVPTDLNPIEKETFKMKMKKKIYKWHPEFKYSIRVIAAFTVSGIALYYLMVTFLYTVWYTFGYQLRKIVNSETFASGVIKSLQTNMQGVREIRTYFSICITCFYVALVFSAIKSFLVFLNMLAWYRGHMMRLRRGDRSWLPTSIRTLSNSPASLVASSMKYAGFQVAYAAWGYVIFALLLWIVLSLLITLVLYPFFHGQKTFALGLIYKLWPTVLISLVTSFGQQLATKFCFLQQRGAIISINNRRAFHIASYYLFFFNIFLGIFSCLLRIIKSMVIGILFLERVQKSLLPRSFEKMDPGYYAYIGYILTEHSHANPVLCVFYYLLNEHVRNKEKDVVTMNEVADKKPTKNGDSMGLDLLHSEKKRQDRWKIVRNRWNLAYTLVNNPSLAKYRKSQVEDEEEEDLEDGIQKEKKPFVEDRFEMIATPVSV